MRRCRIYTWGPKPKVNRPKVSQSNWIIDVDYKGKGLCNRTFSGCNCWCLGLISDGVREAPLVDDFSDRAVVQPALHCKVWLNSMQHATLHCRSLIHLMIRRFNILPMYLKKMDGLPEHLWRGSSGSSWFSKVSKRWDSPRRQVRAWLWRASYQGKMPLDRLYNGTAFECGSAFEEHLRLGITKLWEFRIQRKGWKLVAHFNLRPSFRNPLDET